MSCSASVIRLICIAALGAMGGFICPDLDRPIGELHWQPSIRAADAAEREGVEDSPRHTVRASCGALVDAKGRNVVHPQAGEKATASRPVHCGTDDAQPQPAATRVAAPAPSPTDATLALSAGRAQDQRTRSKDADESVRLAGGSAVRVGAALLTSGSVIWVLRSSFWAYLLIFGLPLWRDVDLLPIVVRETGDGSVANGMPPSTAAERAVTDVLDATTSPPDQASRRS